MTWSSYRRRMLRTALIIKDVLQDPRGPYVMIKGQIEKMAVTLVVLYYGPN